MGDLAKWELAMQPTLIALHKNQTYDLVQFPKDKNALPNRWIYNHKLTHHDSQPRYKAKLVAKVLKQEQAIDFDDEVFLLVV